MRPNLFEISTKELSQDGFFTWLLRWADPENKIHDQLLNECGVDFVKLLIKEGCGDNIEINGINAKRQQDNIDISVEVNKDYFIIIEDKTYTRDHPGKLRKYIKKASEQCENDNRKLVCIYLKTGAEARSSLKVVEKTGFKVVGRSKLIEFFKKHNNISNNIYTDFVDKINNLEKAEKAFETTAIASWDRDCWTGFYHFLDTNMKNDCGWSYENNPAGGSLCFYWNFFKLEEEYKLYLQIEHAKGKSGKLSFRICDVHDKLKRKDVRTRYSDIVLEKAERNKMEIAKPSRFGNGNSMNVAIVKTEDWLGNNDETINKENVIKKLKQYEEFLSECIKEIA
ncbi:MAG: PD-(D/E)XK nuclease family protein [Chitinispirillales bacterium]|nr:PD-(D/E)XK nuclease family protein [Chitinispirillales bacterium]